MSACHLSSLPAFLPLPSFSTAFGAPLLTLHQTCNRFINRINGATSVEVRVFESSRDPFEFKCLVTNQIIKEVNAHHLKKL